VFGGNKKIAWKEVLAGEKAYNLTGNWMPKETLDAFREFLVGIKVLLQHQWVKVCVH